MMSRRRVNDAKDIVTYGDQMVATLSVRRCEQVDRSVLQETTMGYKSHRALLLLLLLELQEARGAVEWTLFDCRSAAMSYGHCLNRRSEVSEVAGSVRSEEPLCIAGVESATEEALTCATGVDGDQGQVAT